MPRSAVSKLAIVDPHVAMFLVLVWRSENQKYHWYKSQFKASSFKNNQKELMFQLKFKEARKNNNNNVPIQGSQVEAVPSYSRVTFCSIKAFNCLHRYTYIRRANCFTQITYSNVNLIQEHSHRCVQNNIWPNVRSCGSVKMTHKINHHINHTMWKEKGTGRMSRAQKCRI